MKSCSCVAGALAHLLPVLVEQLGWCRHSQVDITFAAGGEDGSPPGEPLLVCDEFIGRNPSTAILKISVGAFSVNSVADGGWLYVLLLRRSGSILDVQATSYVNTTPYLSWFDCMTSSGAGSERIGRRRSGRRQGSR